MRRLFDRRSTAASTGRRAVSPVRDRQRGTILALTAVLITLMVGMLALSIDLGYAFSARNQLQNGVDAAALAGATALRASIEINPSMPQQESLVRELAVLYASYNQVRRFADNPSGTGSNGGQNPNRLVIDPAQVSVDISTDLPRVSINTRLNLPLLFAGLFGLPSATIQSVAQSSVFPVDGGTGGPNACWRPIMIPDTFFDAGGMVRYAGDPQRGPNPFPNQPGDYYRSRFATGARNTAPFVDSLSNIGDWVTGLRDTGLQSESGTRTIMGQYIELRPENYRIPEFGGLPRVTYQTLSAEDYANFGYCGEIRVGDQFVVYNPGYGLIYEEVRRGLSALVRRSEGDLVDTAALTQYRYVRTSAYPAPNSLATIIPVLLFNPVELARNPAVTQLQVTNFGLFYLREVRVDGTLCGYFVREIIAGGTPIDAASFSPDSENRFRQAWLPMATRLLR